MSETVFISSVIVGFEAVRQAAREAVESMGMRPVMAEMAGARPQSPQHALLGEVADADIYLLLLGARYGEPGSSRISPTEEEFEEAKRRNKPIVILRQDVAMEPAQQEFLARAGGGWEEGSLWDRFTDERDVGMKVVRALTNVRQLGDVRELAPQAQARAADLAGGERQAGTSRIDPEKLTGLIERAGRYATGVWSQIDSRGQVQQTAVAVGIPEAGMKVYGRPKAPSSSISMGGMTRLQGTVVAPEPALVARRVDVEGEEIRQRLVAAVRRVFADAGSIEEGS